MSIRAPRSSATRRCSAKALTASGRVHLAFAIKANPNLAVLQVLAQRGLWRGRRVGRRDCAARWPRAWRAERHRLFGRRQDPRRTGRRARCRDRPVQPRARGRRRRARRDRRRARACARRATLRVNPDVDAGTHAKISTGKAENKFGVPIDAGAGDLCAGSPRCPASTLRGIAIHIGSQLLDLAPLEAAYRADRRADRANCARAAIAISHVDLGGGLGVPYKAGEMPPSPAEYGAMVARVTQGLGRRADVRTRPRASPAMPACC